MIERKLLRACYFYLVGYFTIRVTVYQSRESSTTDGFELCERPFGYVKFWASWCPPCHHEISDIVTLYTKYHQKVIFIGVNLTDSDSVQGAQQFVQQYHVPYRIVYDRHNELAQSFGILAIPTTLLLDRSGTVVYRITGEMPQVLHRALAQFVHQDSKRGTFCSENGA